MIGSTSAVLVALLGLTGVARAEPILYASWHAPYGDPAARDTLTGRCDDTGADTLCLSFDPGEDIETFVAITATVGFHAMPPDTLSQRWWFGGGEGNFYNVRVHMDAESTGTTLRPWGMQPMGGMRYDRTSGTGRLRMIYAQSAERPTRLEKGKRYWLARLVFPHPPGPGRVPLCDQPMCIEISSLRLSRGVGPGGPQELIATGGPHRGVTFNAPGSGPCDLLDAPNRPPAWTPPKK
jgi:hypothetical protein